MKHAVVRYKVKPAAVAENERLVRDVYDELEAVAPAGLRYATFKLGDGVSFVHIAQTEDGHTALPELAAFQRFQEGIRERCDEPPLVSGSEVIGSFRMFGE
jgi:hypothetical protein